MKSMTIVALGLLVLVAMAMAKPGEPKEDERAFAAEVADGLLEALTEDQSKLWYRNQSGITIEATPD